MWRASGSSSTTRPRSPTSFEGVVEGGGAGEEFEIVGNVVILPNDYVTLSNVANPGFTPDYVYGTGFGLADNGDTIRLLCEHGLVDEVIYDNGMTFRSRWVRA